VVARYLDERHVSYVLVDHRETFRAVDEARASRAHPADTVKTVLLRDSEGYVAAVVIDRQLVERGRILCSAGDHRHALLMDPVDVIGEGYSRIGDICR
jgi:prolyl-tRNA editing enzyme YbaK/EbsC (Cys-tRNA(Pro) deacylase)